MQNETVNALRFEGGALRACRDPLTVERPLQIKLNGKPFSVTMRSPGDDAYLVKGLLFTEGVVRDGGDGACVLREELDPRSGELLAIDVAIPPAFLCDRAHEKRALLASAACGLCGQREFDAAALDAPALPPVEPLRLSRVATLMDAMRASQRTFQQTGSTHAAALFTIDGAPICAFEDIGRHNAVDKAIGFVLAHPPAAPARILAVSGRISFEIVAKAYRAALPYLLAVSAPSSFAVRMSERWGITLLGYCREDRATVYSHPENTCV